MASRAAGSILIFHRTESGWQRLPALAGFPDTLRVSSGGMVWALTFGRLSRWDGARWNHYGSADFGTKTSYVTGFALDGEQLWASTHEGVVHWNGPNWQLYPEVVASPGASMVAGDGQAWVIDPGGTLFLFSGRQWWSRAWTDHPASGTPKLARTSDGTVWLGWHGIWRWDGAGWTPVTEGTDHLTDAQLVGETGDRLWLWDFSGLRSVSTNGKDWTAYAPDRTGLTDHAWVRDVASARGRTWFAATTGLLEFDGTLWRPLPLPGGGVAGIANVAAGPDGALWVIGSPSSGSLQAVFYFSVVMGLAVVVAIIWFFRRLKRRRLEQHQLVTQAVEHATGEVPEELEQGAGRLARSGVLAVVEFIGAIVAYFLLRRFWPQAPLWAIPVLGAAIYLVVTFQQSLVKRRPRPSDPIGPGAPSSYDWGRSWKAVLGGLLVLLFFNADRLPMLRFLRGYFFWILVGVPIAYHALMLNLMNRATRRGDYDGALKLIRWFYFYNPSSMEALRMSGHMLLLAGRYREAEVTLRRSLASSQARESYGSALEYLGDALMEQGRYEEASRSYEAALHAFPWLHRPYRGLAEMLLRQEKNPEEALARVEEIVDFSGLSWHKRKLNGAPQDDYWALKAWALARLGRSSEAALAIENALKATNKDCLPDLAATHYRAGMAMQALGHLTSANQHFRRAVELDPRGRRGTLANMALREGSVWGGVRV